MQNCSVCGCLEGSEDCRRMNHAPVSIFIYEGAEFLSDPCIVMGCCLHYGHDGKHDLGAKAIEAGEV